MKSCANCSSREVCKWRPDCFLIEVPTLSNTEHIEAIKFEEFKEKLLELHGNYCKYYLHAFH